MSIESFIHQCETLTPQINQSLVKFDIDPVNARRISSHMRSIIENTVKTSPTMYPDKHFYNPPKKSLASWLSLKIHFFDGNGVTRMYIHLPSSIPNNPKKSIKDTVLIQGSSQGLFIYPIIRLTMTPFYGEDISQMYFEARTATELSVRQSEMHTHFYPCTTDSINYKGKRGEKIMMYQERCDGDFHDLLFDDHPLHKIVMGNMQVLLPIFKNLSEALKLMHEKKIIHGDLKLENLLYKVISTPQNHQYLEALLTDFGAVCRFEHKTRGNFIKGTPLTYAPERIELLNINDIDFKPEMVDEKTDIWSLGVIFHVLYFINYPKYSLIGDEIHQIINELILLNNRNSRARKFSQIMEKRRKLKDLIDSAKQEKLKWQKANPKIELIKFEELLKQGKIQSYFENIIFQMLQSDPKDRLSIHEVCNLLTPLATRILEPVSTHQQPPREKSPEIASLSETMMNSQITDSLL